MKADRAKLEEEARAAGVYDDEVGESGWGVAVDGEGRPYYFDTHGGSTYEKPDALKTPGELEAGKAGGGGRRDAKLVALDSAVGGCVVGRDLAVDQV